MHPLTDRQARVIDFIRAFVAERGYPPTHAEIAAGLKFRSPNAATEHVRLLAKKGALQVEPGVSRGLRVLHPGSARARAPLSPLSIMRRATRESTGLPLVGEVAAGQPILAAANIERVVDVDPALFRPRADFLLRVRGDSMIEADLRPDDLLAVHRTPVAEEGAIAVVRLDDDVTVKRFRTRRRGREPRASRDILPRASRDMIIVLEPANARLSPIVVDPSRVAVAIEGVAVGLLRLRKLA